MLLQFVDELLNTLKIDKVDIQNFVRQYKFLIMDVPDLFRKLEKQRL